MTTLNLAGYPTDDYRRNWDRCIALEVPHNLMLFFGRVGNQWLATAPGRVVTQQLWPALGGATDNHFWRPNSTTVDIDLSGLTRKELSSLARLLDQFARDYPNTEPIKSFVATIKAEDAAAHPGDVPLFDV